MGVLNGENYTIIWTFLKLFSINTAIESKNLNIERYFCCFNDSICKMDNY